MAIQDWWGRPWQCSYLCVHAGKYRGNFTGFPQVVPERCIKLQTFRGRTAYPRSSDRRVYMIRQNDELQHECVPPRLVESAARRRLCPPSSVHCL